LPVEQKHTAATGTATQALDGLDQAWSIATLSTKPASALRHRLRIYRPDARPRSVWLVCVVSSWRKTAASQFLLPAHAATA
jgi:hypothetical protein